MSNMINNSIFTKQVWDEISSHQYKYVYFDGYTNTKAYGRRSAYENQQGVMNAEWQNAVKVPTNISNGINQVISTFRTKQKVALNKEESLIREMKYEKDYKNLPEKKRMALWTKMFLFNGDKTRLWDPSNPNDTRVAFALFINSSDFITLYRSSVIYSVLRSTEYGKAIGRDISKLQGQEKQEEKDDIRREFMKMLSSKSGAKYNAFRKAIIDSMRDYFKDSGIGEAIIEDMVKDALKEVRSKNDNYAKRNGYFTIEEEGKVGSFSKLLDGGGKKLSINTIYDNAKNNLKGSLEGMLRAAYRKVEGTSTYNDWRASHLVDDVLESLKIKMGPADDPYIIMEITPETKTPNVYKSAPNASAEEKKNSFLAAVEECYSQLSGRKISLNAGFINNLDLSGTNYWNCVKSYINNHLRNAVDAIKNSTFFTQDWNASAMTGMLEELSAYLTHSQSLADMSLTGTTADKIMNEFGEELRLRESFKDLTFAFNRKKYGINVKRYTTQQANSFTLYSDSKGVGINSQYMYRYFTPEEVNLMRFVALNRNFIVDNLSMETDNTADQAMTDLYQSMSVMRMDNFIRLSSAASDTINLFYVINNITIPASVIYGYIIKTLSNLQIAKSLFNISINQTPDAEEVKISEGATYDDLPKEVDTSQSNSLLRSSIKIKFKGLKLDDLKLLL